MSDIDKQLYDAWCDFVKCKKGAITSPPSHNFEIGFKSGYKAGKKAALDECKRLLDEQENGWCSK